MYKKLDEETIEKILETGIDEFAEHGLDRANINVIAKKAGISVGVLYKYYKGKDEFFLACVKYSLRLLEEAFQAVIANEDDIRTCIRLLVEELLDGAEKHRNYYVMYNEITSGSCRKYATKLAQSIEGQTGLLYAELVKRAKEEGKATYDGDPRMFAFFFDSLLMMLQFSVSCEYYKERMRIFCGADVMENTDSVAEAFCDFIERAVGIV